MTPSLADSFAHALGLLSIDGKPDVNLSTGAGKEQARQLLDEHIATYHVMDGSEDPSLVDSARDNVANFASRFLPALAEMMINGELGAFDTDVHYLARVWLLKLSEAPAFGHLLRARPLTYKALFASQIDDLALSIGRCNDQSPSSDGIAAAEPYDSFVLVAGVTAQMLGLSVLHNNPASFFGVSKDALAQLGRPYSRFRRVKVSEDEIADKCLSLIDAIIFYFLSGESSSLESFVPPACRYWMRCKAAASAELGPYTELSAGQEMSCCGKCLAVRYCSKAHQKAHWKAHKPVCFKPTW